MKVWQFDVVLGQSLGRVQSNRHSVQAEDAEAAHEAAQALLDMKYGPNTYRATVIRNDDPIIGEFIYTEKVS